MKIQCQTNTKDNKNRDMIPWQPGSPVRSMSVPPVFALRLEPYDYGTKSATKSDTNWPRVLVLLHTSNFASN